MSNRASTILGGGLKDGEASPPPNDSPTGAPGYQTLFNMAESDKYDGSARAMRSSPVREKQ